MFLLSECNTIVNNQWFLYVILIGIIMKRWYYMILTSILIAGAMTPAVTVQQGDTYKTIAQENNVSIEQLEQVNNREVGGFDLIFPNETVLLPRTSQNDVQANNAQSNVINNEQQTNGTESQNMVNNVQGSDVTVKVSFYDPAVLGSNMGYGGVATNNAVYPKGTQLRITLADGTVYNRIVNDTGEFVYSNPNQIDLALPNSQVPSCGVTTATVEVLS